MATIAVISQKDGAGKTTLAIHLAAAAHEAGRVALIVDTDPQATASQWTARAAMELADLVLIPCRPSAFDLAAIQTTAKLVQLLRKPAFVVFTAGAPKRAAHVRGGGRAGPGLRHARRPRPDPRPCRLSPRQRARRDRHGAGTCGARRGRRAPTLRVDMSTDRHEGGCMTRKLSFANLGSVPAEGGMTP